MNISDENKFLDIVYRYYPRQIESGSHQYHFSPEYIRLKKLIGNATKENLITKKLKRFLFDYIKKNKNLSVQDYTLFVSEDRCYNIQLINDNYEKNIMHSICINISLLIPYYTIHVLETKRSEDYKKRISNPKRKVELEEKNYKEIIHSIKEFLNTNLNLTPFPHRLLFKIIPDISFQNSGFKKFSFYNAFFLDDFYTR
ncbi:hypothetical protein [Wocania ichthyoenteri]|uniref:hypothetical protein n=1 Tax=Wocania ichthyoenteri TaxID=1230531 RepID=UPI00053EA799|nr:hypothetical protein [Wocania ichthyoenteri]